MVERLDGKIAIITGAGQGIGEAIAIAFAPRRRGVVIAERNRDNRPGDRRGHRRGGRRAAFSSRPTSPSPTRSSNPWSRRRIPAFGRIDILVNNAGINVFHEPLETTEEEWRRCFAVDLEGVWTVSKAVLPPSAGAQRRRHRQHRLSHSFSIIPDCFPYPVAKHGLLGLTRALGIQYAAENIRVNAIAPGYVETPIALDYWNTFPDPAAERQRACDLHPPKRIGRPGGGGDDRALPGVRRGAVHQRRLHRHRWRAVGSLPRDEGMRVGRPRQSLSAPQARTRKPGWRRT